VPRITDFCVCIYVFRCKLSLFSLCDSDFGITPVDDIAIGINWTAFCFHIAHISFASSWYLFCLSVIVLARLCIFGTPMSIEKVFFVFLFVKVMSGRLKVIVLSVSMLRFQYSLKLSFSRTLAGVYLYYYYYHHYLLYSGYWYIYSWDKPCSWGIQCFSYSGITISGACNTTFCYFTLR